MIRSSGAAIAADWFMRAVSLCYKRPQNVMRRMRRFYAVNGPVAFLEKLSEQPALFGTRLPLVRDDRIVDRAQRKEARHAAVLLPLLAVDALSGNEAGPVMRRRKAQNA